ncbi:hypothetical protein [Sulfurospirillum arsenophilum]|uniref:hypothetical protein n=1 Tax=Sulfurospirillum arsenophilum TaxID=56698 RepID=UPI0005A708C7|nr:hypothetical protein [Sulfurospirillum arsenophilum]
MRKLYFILFALFATNLFAYNEFLMDGINFKQLEKCKNFYIQEQNVKIINLLNGKKLELKNEFSENDDEFEVLIYTIKGCFFKEKYLIVSEWAPDTEVYYAINLRDGQMMEINGMPYLSPNRKYFATEYYGGEISSDPPRFSIYSFKGNQIKRIFTQEYPYDSSVFRTKWINNQNIHFYIASDYRYDPDKNTFIGKTIDELKLTFKSGKWRIIKDEETSKIKK